MLKGMITWVDDRMPLLSVWREHFSEYYAPKNFNIWYFFGALALLVFVNQVLTGLWLTMFYKPSAKDAFDSVEYIMRDVNYGWLIRYMHSTGASAFFVVVYLHMFRGLLYGSFKKPRELLWVLGMVLYLMMTAEAFFGYLLPWGQMSYWGAQVITSLFGAIPYVGDMFALWLRGDFNIADSTLNRFFALHVVGIPFLMAMMIFLHIVALHKVGSNNPDGIEIKETKDENGVPLDGIPFHPYYTVKDSVGVVVFLLVFSFVIFFMPELGGYFLEHANFAAANPMVTPEHIAPVWYLTPFYSILRAIPDKLLGVMAMGASIGLLFVIPWLDKSPVKSMRYRGIYSKIALSAFVTSFFVLGYLGTVAVSPLRQFMAQFFTVVYFAFFILMPVYTRFETCKPVPSRVRT